MRLLRLLFLLSLSLLDSAAAAPVVWDILRQQFSLNHEVTRPEVQDQIRWLVAHPSYIQKACQQSEPYIYHIVFEIRKRHLPGELALLPMIESAFDPFAYSGAGAAGLWQLMPGTGSDLGLKQDWWFDGRRSVSGSTDAALNYLLYLNNYFNGNWTLAVAAYDAGAGTVSRAVKANQNTVFWQLSLPQETRNYVPRLFALAEILTNPRGYGVEIPAIPYLPYFTEVTINSPIDLNHAAKMAGMSYKELIKLNPGFNRWTTAPYKPVLLLLPIEKVRYFMQNLAHLPLEKRVSWLKHRVEAGDTLASIAARYHTTVNMIKQLNQLSSERLNLKQFLLIPSTNNSPVAVAAQPVSKPSVVNKIIEPGIHRVVHIVQPTDDIASLERLYHINATDLRDWNHLDNAQALQVGQQLIIWKKLQQPQLYIVKSGDSLSTLAQAHHSKVKDIIALNPGLKITSPLHPGQKLRLG